MPINFPNSPGLNDLYSYDNKTWEWNGIYWEVYSALTSYITSAYTAGDGVSDISGVTNGNIVLKSFSGVNISIIDEGDKLTFSGSSGNITGGGTSNYLPKWSGSTSLVNSLVYDATTGVTIGSGFTWDNTNSRLGIGTNTPAAKLQLKSSGINTDVISVLNTSNSSLFRVFNGGGGQSIVDIAGAIFLRSDSALSYINSGNFAIGTTTDSGFKLDVNGTARIQGNTNIINSSGPSILTLGGFNNLPELRFINTNTKITVDANSAINFVSSWGVVTNHYLFYPASNLSNTSTSGVVNGVVLNIGFAPTSGTASFNQLSLVQTINQTGGASGITRGVYVNPTLTSAADFRAIETTSGKVIFNGGDVGIGTDSPIYKVDVQGTTLAASSVRVQGSFDINPLAAPPVIGGFTLSSGTNLGVGQYYYFVVYVTNLGETSAGATITVTTTSGNTTVNLTGIPISSDSRVTARKLYRTKLGGTSDNQWFLATISNNVTTTYTDSIADASLTGVSLQSYKVNTTARYVTVSGIQGMVIDTNLTTLGRNAGNAIITSNGAAIRTVLIGALAGQNITTGQANVIVGVAGGNLTTGGSNTLIGDLAGFALVNGGSNTIMGSQSGRFLNSASNNVVLGANAGNRLNDGTTSLTAPTNSIYIGVNARGNSDTETNTIVIGNTALGLGSNTTVIGNNSTIFTSIPAGNLGVGTTTNTGYKLDVNGTARISNNTLIVGGGATSSTNALIIQNSGTTTLFYIDNSGQAFFNNRIAVNRIQPLSSTNIVEIAGGVGSATGGSGIGLNQFTNVTNTSGTHNRIESTGAFLPVSGTGVFNAFQISGTINQTGGANGITRGLYINPTLTSAADYRAIETTNGNVKFGSNFIWDNTNSRLGININTPAQALEVWGTSFISGRVGLGSAYPIAGTQLLVTGQLTGAVIAYGIRQAGYVQTDTTLQAIGFANQLNKQSVNVLGTYYNYYAVGGGVVSGSVTNQMGFAVASNVTNATNNYAFHSELASASNVWNLYMAGTALNHLNGSLLIGTTTDAGYKLDVNGNIRVSTIYFNGTATTGNISATGSSLEFNAPTSFGVFNFNCSGGGRRVSINGTASDTVGNDLLSIPFVVQNTTGTNRNFSMLNVNPTINNTSGYTGIVRGLYYNPTITSLVGTTHRAIETTVGTVVLNSVSGSTLIGKTTDSGQKLQVSGDTLLQGSLTATTKTTIGSESDISCALLQMASTTQGVLFPRMTNTQRTSISSPVAGLMVYCTDSPEGLFIYKSTGWVQII